MSLTVTINLDMLPYKSDRRNKILAHINKRTLTSATRHVRQQWFSGCSFPLGKLDGLKGDGSPSASSISINVTNRQLAIKQHFI